MITQRISLPEIKLIGISVRTNNAKEMGPEGHISGCIERYFQTGLFHMIPHRVRAGVTYCAYHDYESDHTGDYTFLIGEEVESVEVIPHGFDSCIIMPQTYVRHTTPAGQMPQVVINAWQEIWQAGTEGLGAERSFKGDFELYDERARNPRNAIVDIFIGIKDQS